jgi:NADH-quinone oxidoreductase subunit C
MARAVLDQLRAQFGHVVVETHEQHGDDTAVIQRDHVAEVARFLRDTPVLAFNMLVDITAVDHLGRRDETERFEVVYHLYSLQHRHRVRLKVRVGDVDPHVPTLSRLWGAANWAEREVWDMYGIRFDGHPDLRRILLYESFKGFPLRKDFPLDGEQAIVDEGPVTTEGVCTPIPEDAPHLPVIDHADEQARDYVRSRP